jgi:hypothetical protein
MYNDKYKYEFMPGISGVRDQMKVKLIASDAEPIENCGMVETGEGRTPSYRLIFNVLKQRRALVVQFQE